MARKPNDPKATNWEKLSGRSADQTLKNRDVFEHQQLDRSAIDGLQTKTGRTVVAAIVGVVVTLLTWVVLSALFMVIALFSPAEGSAPVSTGYYQVEKHGSTVRDYCFQILDETGASSPELPCYKTEQEAKDNPPAWWTDAEAAAEADAEKPADEGLTFVVPQGGFLGELFNFGLWKVLLAFIAGFGAFGLLHQVLMRNLDAQNLMNDTRDINQYTGDQHIALPDEVMRKFDWFPDVGAHSDVQVSSMISHVMITNKGLKKIEVAVRADEDVLDEDGDVEYLKGEILRDENEDAITKTVPMIDEAFGDALFDASGIPDQKNLRKKYETTSVPYNEDGEDRDKLGKFKTVADLINKDWTLPEYEVQRPGGAYIVDTAPVNTMVLAITRGGKGQTYIEPVIDMWLREKRPNNMVINDPKGELLVKNYVRATMRGFQVVQFNLINAMKTDIYNPLGMAADAAREGDATKCALYVENIADVFFPLDGGEDPVWPNAANNAFKRAAYGLIDYYLEEERELRAFAARTDMDAKVLDKRLDEMWGKVTLYNCYQLFVQLTAKKMKNPLKALEARAKRGEFGDPQGDDFDADAYEEEREVAQRKAFLWEDKDELDMLTLFFNASGNLPQNAMRTLVSNADNALRAMGAAEKMLASVYGIALTAMSFFADPTISTLTSGAPSQNSDLGGLSFPRRMGVRFGMNYLKRDHLIGSQAKWDAFTDSTFETALGKDFEHEDIVSREGWARYYFQGKFEGDVAFLRLRLLNPQTGMLIRSFFFRFTKDYQTSLNGRYYITDPITKEKIVKNGILVELRKDEASGEYKPGHTTYPQMRLTNITFGMPDKEMGEAQAIISNMVRYSEKPKVVFLVTPPHLMKYAKLVLILVKQLVDLNFDKSYMTKSNQKPLYKTRFMLDELGNLQSEGHGISGFETMLSIGLGQDQQFTIILQTLQQLRDVYGESVDKIVQGNPQPLDALISTPAGWMRMGDAEVGTKVHTPFGTTSEITAVYPKGVQPVYRLTLRDGSSTEASAGHIWAIERWKSSFLKVAGKAVGFGPGNKTSTRVSEQMTTEQIKAQIEKGRAVDLPRIAPVEYAEAVLPIDPYVLGAILGDGHVQPNGVVKFTCNDPETVEEIRRRGYVVVDDTVRGERKDGIGYRINGVNASLRDLGVAGKRSWEKSIPDLYLLGSVQQRVDLLRGLMDTDGTISAKGEMEFSSASQELAEGVQTLIRSLGGRVAINVKTNVMYTSPNQVEPKQARDAHRVQNIRLPEINPFLLTRKADRWKDRTRGFNRVVSVEYVRDDEVQCISIADDRHLYITDDFIPTHNTSNIVFLKSTDDSMLDTLQKMSGTRHVTYRDSKTVTKDTERMIKGLNVEGKVSYTMSTKEEPVISYNDMAFISERNSIVFRAGDAPVWNRNETILPMSWRLFKDTIVDPGHDYTLQTIPTLSSALDFDVRLNQPDFEKMLAKRMLQAENAVDCKVIYQEAYEYKDVDIARLDPDVYSDEVMELVDASMRESIAEDMDLDADEVDLDDAPEGFYDNGDWEADMEMQAAARAAEANAAVRQTMLYAGKQISRDMLVRGDGKALINTLDREIVEAYKAARAYMERDSRHFSVGSGGSLRSADGQTLYIDKLDESQSMQALNDAAQDGGTRVYAEEDIKDLTGYEVTGEFYEFLASLDGWQDLAGGEFERSMMLAMRDRE
ncbi:MAG: type IV secretory system conjugative DNA transfer family protein [Mycetocola sp.]